MILSSISNAAKLPTPQHIQLSINYSMRFHSNIAENDLNIRRLTQIFFSWLDCHFGNYQPIKLICFAFIVQLLILNDCISIYTFEQGLHYLNHCIRQRLHCIIYNIFDSFYHFFSFPNRVESHYCCMSNVTSMNLKNVCVTLLAPKQKF